MKKKLLYKLCHNNITSKAQTNAHKLFIATLGNIVCYFLK